MPSEYEALVAALSGNFDPKVVDALAQKLSTMPKGKKNRTKEAKYVPGVFLKKKKYEQNHVGLLWKGFGQEDPRRFAAALLSAILGGGAVTVAVTAAVTAGIVLLALAFLLRRQPRDFVRGEGL